MAIGAVTDFAASDARIGPGAPSSHAISTAEPIAVIEPATSAAHIGRRLRRTATRLRQSGSPSATVAGSEQEVHELGALEVGGVAGAGGGQKSDQQAGGDHHRVRQRMAAETSPRSGHRPRTRPGSR